MLFSTPDTVKGWYWEADTLGTQIHTVACGLTLALCARTCKIRPKSKAQNESASPACYAIAPVGILQ